MKRPALFLAALAVATTLYAAVGGASAYFTANTQAKGGYPIRLGTEEILTERLYSWTKHVSISADADSGPVYVRAKALCASSYTLSYPVSESWSPSADGYCYYDKILYGGQTSDELQILIGNIPENPGDGDSFNVVVVFETTPVLFSQDGSPYADWTLRLESVG